MIGLKMDHSANVHLEDLHNTRDLETTYYVTDRTQASDFKWVRESQLVVKIGIMNIHLIPHYEDADHKGDNQYILSNPFYSEDKLKFTDIVDNHCRNPIPDFYSVTLDISRDRMTAGKMVTCDSRNPALPDCPEAKTDGDTYLERTLNQPCLKMGTFPEKLEPAVNSILCTENTALLRELFNRTYTEEKAIRFPSDKCKKAQSRCEQCMKANGCHLLELFEARCCRIDCYSLPICKQMRSPECTEAPVECAMGDAYRYTLHPVYQRISDEFRCHIQRKPPEILYEIFYYMEMPSTGFVTPKQYKTIYAKDLMYESQGEYQTDYITIEHNTGIDLMEEFLLVGQEIVESEAESKKVRLNYTIYPMKTEKDFARNKSPVVHPVKHDAYVATTEFVRPFDYGTSSWVQGKTCHKDVTKFKYYDPEAPAYKQPGQTVQVTTVKSSSGGDKAFKYWLQGEGSPPLIRFTIPGNMSILPWHFQGKNVELLVNDDYFTTELVLAPGGKVWNINIQGRMSDCPAYLGIRINDREEMEELIRSDLLIMCPTTFNLTFYIPNFGVQLDKTFDIHFDDTKKTYHTYLTHLNLGINNQVNDPEAVVIVPGSGVYYVVFVILGCFTLVSLAIFNKFYLYTEVLKAKRKVFHTMKENQLFSGGGYSGSGGVDTMNSDVYNDSQLSNDPSCGNQLTSGQMIFLVIYVVLRIVYSLLFTFTVFFAVLMIFIKSDVSRLSNLDDFVQDAKNKSLSVSHEIDKHWRVELLRQAEKVTDMQGACSNYVKELFDSMAFQMNNITYNYYDSELYGTNTSISYLMHQRTENILADITSKIQNYSTEHKDSILRKIKPAVNKYRHFISSVFMNQWPSFAQKLFNSSDFHRIYKESLSMEPDLLLKGQESDFMRFMEIEEVDFVRSWALKYWQKYELMLPDTPSLPVPSIDIHNLHCQLSGGPTQSFNITQQPALTKMDSARYFSPDLPADVKQGPVYYNGKTRHEYKFVTPAPPPLSKNTQLGAEELEVKSMVNTEILSIIFLVLDAILLLYRFSHTYMNASKIVKGFIEEFSKEDMEEFEFYSRPVTSSAGTLGSGSSKYKHMSDYSHIPLGQGIVDSNTFQYEYHGNGGPGGLQGNGLGYKANPDMRNEHKIVNTATLTSTMSSHTPGIYYRSGRTDFCKILSDTCAKVLLSNNLPIVLMGCCLLVLVYILMKFVCEVVDMNYVLDSNLLSAMYASGMDVQINQTNWYLADQAQYFNHVSMNIYQGQMRSELKYLQSMLQYFDLEQKRLVDNHLLEGCSIQYSSAVNWTCDIHIEPPTLSIPLLPCNFVPIAPSLFSDSAPIELEQKLVKSLEPYIISSRYVVVVLTYILFLSIAAMLVIHLLGVVVFHFIKSSNRFPVRRVYITSYLPDSFNGVTLEADDTNLLHYHPGDNMGLEDLPPPPTEESDYDSSEDNLDSRSGNIAWSHTLPNKHQGYHSNDRFTRTIPSPSKRHQQKRTGNHQQSEAGTLLNDFKYSETKV